MVRMFVFGITCSLVVNVIANYQTLAKMSTAGVCGNEKPAELRGL